MLTRFIKRQLVMFGILTAITAVALGWYYLQIPSAVGIGQYTLKADLPASGGLYKTSNVTYRGETIGTVTAVEPTETGARVTMSIGDRYKIPIDASANVHSVSAVGEQYLDLVSAGNPGKYFSPGQTITKGTVPTEIGPALDAANRGLAVLPKDKIASLLDETAQAVGGLGPALQRLVDATQAIAGDFKTNISDINDIIQNSGPIIDSQVNSGDSIERWSHNLNILAAQSAENDQHVQKHPDPSGADRRSGQRGVQRRPRVAAADTGQSRDRAGHAQALPQGRRATAGGLSAGRLGRPDGHDGLPGLRVARHLADDQPAPAVPDRVPPGIRSGGLPRTPAWRRCRPEPIARSRRTLRPTPCAGRATSRVSMCPGNARRRRGSAATPNLTFRWAPTRGTATPTRS